MCLFAAKLGLAFNKCEEECLFFFADRNKSDLLSSNLSPSNCYCFDKTTNKTRKDK